jgi:hypothetical protein
MQRITLDALVALCIRDGFKVADTVIAFLPGKADKIKGMFNNKQRSIAKTGILVFRP